MSANWIGNARSGLGTSPGVPAQTRKAIAVGFTSEEIRLSRLGTAQDETFARYPYGESAEFIVADKAKQGAICQTVRRSKRPVRVLRR